MAWSTVGLETFVFSKSAKWPVLTDSNNSGDDAMIENNEVRSATSSAVSKDGDVDRGQ